MKNYIALAGLFLLALITEAAAGSPFLMVDGKLIKWKEPELGTKATITYTYLTTPYEFVGGVSAHNCRSAQPIGAFLKAANISLDVFRTETEKALAGWARIANVRFEYTKSVDGADMLIGSFESEGKSLFALTNLVVERRPGTTNRITKSIFCLNTRSSWQVDPSEDEETASIKRVVEHEAGHVLGLDHLNKQARAVMAYAASERPFAEADICNAQHLYGPPR